MSWSKLKTIIIYILLLLNLFLLGLVGMNRLRAKRYEEAALSEAAAVLEHNNIAVDRSGLPGESELRAATVARDIEKEGRLARILLGEDVLVSPAGGGMYVYRGAAGEADFRGNGEFTVTFGQPLEEAPPGADSPRALMKALGLRVWETWETEDSATAAQSLGGAPVYSGSSGQALGVTYAYDAQGKLSGVSGRIFSGKLAADQESEETLSLSTALISFFGFLSDSGDVCREIRQVSPVYRVAAAGDPVRLTPAWQFTTDTGEYFLDACTAEVTRRAGE